MFYIRYSGLFWVYFKKSNESIDNPPLRIFVNKIENSIEFKNKTRYHIELLIPEKMKLLGSTKIR